MNFQKRASVTSSPRWQLVCPVLGHWVCYPISLQQPCEGRPEKSKDSTTEHLVVLTSGQLILGLHNSLHDKSSAQQLRGCGYSFPHEGSLWLVFILFLLLCLFPQCPLALLPWSDPSSRLSPCPLLPPCGQLWKRSS